ncbi:hypothetical protein EJ02DRAFT_513376 [Clathrospora elynae]|uniref:Uncharacterized protein n=1 Tax=Clathrospora elynae TaxID=706981 RepID=A0A6A5SKV1_9PLEO|nr:hypothetical protein EJ02DRAFT_513376 [Clathrospora elynae]
MVQSLLRLPAEPLFHILDFVPVDCILPFCTIVGYGPRFDPSPSSWLSGPPSPEDGTDINEMGWLARGIQARRTVAQELFADERLATPYMGAPLFLLPPQRPDRVAVTRSCVSTWCVQLDHAVLDLDMGIRPRKDSFMSAGPFDGDLDLGKRSRENNPTVESFDVDLAAATITVDSRLTLKIFLRTEAEVARKMWQFVANAFDEHST